MDYDLVPIVSVGWIVARDQDRLVLCADYYQTHIGRVTAIPMGSVKKIVKLVQKE